MKEHKFLNKALAVILSTLVVLPFAGCDLAQDIKSNVEDRINHVQDVSEQELTRLIITTINDSRETADVFSSISETQIDGLSYSYFSEYMSILREISRQDSKGKVLSFRLMDEQECVSIIGEDLTEEYGDIVGAELLYEEEAQYPVYIFFKKNSDGVVCLSSEWVTAIINIYNYASHYFTMLSDENADGVMALLEPGLTADEYTEEVIYSRAEALCEFYKMRVKSSSSDYEITEILPDELIYRIPETVSSDGSSFEEHIVIFEALSSGNFSIIDEVTQASDINLLYLTYGEERLFRVGGIYSSSVLYSLMGDPISVSVYPDTGMAIVKYKGVNIRVEGTVESEDEWQGTVTSIRFYSTSSNMLGYNLYVGMTKSQILELYPFADIEDYVISITSGAHTYSITFEFDEDNTVEEIKITE